MAVIYCVRRDDKKGNKDENKKTFTETFIVKTDSESDEPATIYLSTFVNLPKVGDDHPVDPTVKVKSISVKPTANRKIYELDVTYDDAATNGDQGGGGGGGGSVEVLRVSLSAWEEEFVQDYRLDGKGGKPEPFVNTADEPIKYMATRPQVLISITAQTTDPKLGKLIYLVNTVNKNQVNWIGLTFKTGQLMFSNYSATSSGGNQWTETFEFKGKIYAAPTDYENLLEVEGGWQPYILNAGLMEWVEGDNGKELRPIYPIEDTGKRPSNNPVSSPWPLNSNGEAIARKQIAERKIYLNPKMFREQDFSIFNFDFAPLLSRDKQLELGLR